MVNGQAVLSDQHTPVGGGVIGGVVRLDSTLL
jgi:hypothetical protein